jgi:choline dehydrogenase-like flavoprotein
MDASVFPTSSGYNPTLTIIAVALRLAHGLVGTGPEVPDELPPSAAGARG